MHINESPEYGLTSKLGYFRRELCSQCSFQFFAIGYIFSTSTYGRVDGVNRTLFTHLKIVKIQFAINNVVFMLELAIYITYWTIFDLIHVDFNLFKNRPFLKSIIYVRSRKCYWSGYQLMFL